MSSSRQQMSTAVIDLSYVTIKPSSEATEQAINALCHFSALTDGRVWLRSTSGAHFVPGLMNLWTTCVRHRGTVVRGAEQMCSITVEETVTERVMLQWRQRFTAG